ncbi:MAG: hypothetical protein LQ350_002902 [Teloschistes chrysophthalmus]|nr:MAG: hypothetical protein LQ350_002902 [Niorma chrysophthalma]
MYGEDSSGRKISLLNANGGASASKPQHVTTPNPITSPPATTPYQPLSPSTLPPLVFKEDRARGHRTRRLPSPPKSPSRTPPLVRHNSVGSQSESTTSPMTPGYPQDPMDPHSKSTPYFSYPRPTPQIYTSMAQLSTPFPAQPSYYMPSREMAHHLDTGNGSGALNQQALLYLPPPLSYPNPEPAMTVPSPPSHLAQRSSSTAASVSSPSQSNNERPTSHSASTQTSNTTPSSASPTDPKRPKKRFPCPHATRFACSDTFTTSGHAARHGKKHTGEKSVICPTCNKAFTRKDNMKQHERTHRPRDDGTGTTNSTSNGGRQRDGRSRSPPIPSPTESTASAETDNEGLDFGASSSYLDGMMANQHHLPSKNKMKIKKERGRGHTRAQQQRSEEDGEGESPGLDALAAAAVMG